MTNKTTQRITMILSIFAAITAIASLVVGIVALASRKGDKKKLDAMTCEFDHNNFLVDSDDYDDSYEVPEDGEEQVF